MPKATKSKTLFVFLIRDRDQSFFVAHETKKKALEFVNNKTGKRFLMVDATKTEMFIFGKPKIECEIITG